MYFQEHFVKSDTFIITNIHHSWSIYKEECVGECNNEYVYFIRLKYEYVVASDISEIYPAVIDILNFGNKPKKDVYYMYYEYGGFVIGDGRNRNSDLEKSVMDSIW